MRLLRPGELVLAAIVAAACRESTGPGTIVRPGLVTWIEWPAEVRSTDTDSIRISASVPSCFKAEYGVVVEGRAVRVTVQARGLNLGCPELSSATGAGYDTVLALPRLGVGIEAQFPVYTISAPLPSGPSYRDLDQPTERTLGFISVLYAPDTTTDFAGAAWLTVDSNGCWRAQPWSEGPRPRWALSASPSLTPDWSGRPALLIGQFVPGSPAACGDAQSVQPVTLEVDATP